MKRYLSTLLAMLLAFMCIAGLGGRTVTAADGAKELTWARAYESTSLDPAQSADDESNNIVSYTTERLTRVIGGDAVPGIAESWDISDDGLIYTFHLRESLWSDGTPLTANDFVYAFFRLIDPEKGYAQASGGYIVKNARAFAEGTAERDQVGYKALDELTVEITFENVSLENLFNVASTNFAPIQAAAAEAADIAYGSDKDAVLGNGPFVIEEWSHEDKIVLVKNENYWNAGAINLTKLTGLANVANDTAVEMMLTDAVDLSPFRTPTFFNQLYDAGFEGITTTQSDQFLHINHKGKSEEAGKFLSNVNFRRALSYALDRTALCATVFEGQTPANRLIDPDAVGLDGQKFVAQYPLPEGVAINETADAAKAQEYLQLALEEIGGTIEDVPELYMLCYESQNSQTALQAAQDMFLNVLGVRCVIDPQPIQQMIAKVYSFDYDFWLGGVAIGTVDAASPGGVLQYYDGTNPDALFGYENETYSALLKEAQTTLDLSERYEAILEMEQIFIDEVPDLLITWQTEHIVFKPGVVITNVDNSFGADLAFADIAE